MAEYVTGISTAEGTKQIDYNSLANLPDLAFTPEKIGAISTNEKGKPNGVATLNSTGKIPQSQLEISEAVSPYIISDTAPTSTNSLWIDSANDNIMKYYDGSSWQVVPAVWG